MGSADRCAFELPVLLEGGGSRAHAGLTGPLADAGDARAGAVCPGVLLGAGLDFVLAFTSVVSQPPRCRRTYRRRPGTSRQDSRRHDD